MGWDQKAGLRIVVVGSTAAVAVARGTLDDIPYLEAKSGIPATVWYFSPKTEDDRTLMDFETDVGV